MGIDTIRAPIVRFPVELGSDKSGYTDQSVRDMREPGPTL
jgi:hypothetical protein